jgi:two-component sensor histidine kinase
LNAVSRPERLDFSVKAAIGLIALLLLLSVLVLAVSTYQARRDAERGAFARAEAASQVVATNAKWIVELAWQALRHIDDALGPDITNGKGQTVRDIREAVENLPMSVKAYVVDAQGNTLFSTDPQVKPINITDREYFSALAAGAPAYISSLMVSRLDGSQIFVFSRRLERDGKFAGAAIISFDVLLLADVWASLAMDDLSTVSLIRDDGMLVARYPLANGPLDMSKYVLFTDYLKQSPTGIYAAVSPADGVRRFVGYRKVPGTTFVAVASISEHEAYQMFWRNTATTLIVALPIVIALVAAAFWIGRLLRRDAMRQQDLIHALGVNTLLFRDTHHRVKNNLQSIQSLVRMHEIPADAKADLQRRIAAMTAVHEHMYRLDQYTEVDAQQFVPAIVEPLRETFGSDVAFAYDIDPLLVDRDYATPFALLVNEVTTNALKYAFPDGRPGRIRISLKPLDAQRSRLVISDNGVGFDPNAVTSRMGSRLIRGMVTQLEGTFAYARDGGATFSADIVLRRKPEAMPGEKPPVHVTPG